MRSDERIDSYSPMVRSCGENGELQDCLEALRRRVKKWIDTMKDCLKKRGLEVKQARRIVHDRSDGGDL